MNEEKEINYGAYSKIGSSLGFAGGVALAFKNNTGFWKGWGYAIIGSIVVGGVGYSIDYALRQDAIKKNKTAIDRQNKFTQENKDVSYGDVTFR